MVNKTDVVSASSRYKIKLGKQKTSKMIHMEHIRMVRSAMKEKAFVIENIERRFDWESLI